MMRSLGAFLSLPAAAFSVAAATSLHAEPVTRTIIQEQPIEAPQIRAVTAKTVITPGKGTPLHTHPGVEMAYVVQGSAALLIKGKPEWKLASGDSFSVPRDTIHSIRNTGAGPLVIVSTYVVDKGQPLVIPAE